MNQAAFYTSYKCASTLVLGGFCTMKKDS